MLNCWCPENQVKVSLLALFTIANSTHFTHLIYLTHNIETLSHNVHQSGPARRHPAFYSLRFLDEITTPDATRVPFSWGHTICRATGAVAGQDPAANEEPYPPWARLYVSFAPWVWFWHAQGEHARVWCDELIEDTTEWRRVRWWHADPVSWQNERRRYWRENPDSPCYEE